uniref:Light-harvesting complex protein Lhcc6 n=1 Tax=Rhodomonas sp. (strain CS 24) TaxID=79257 RepID=Q4GWU3_RHDS2|nr:light-harvesting complex protein Lhcc6 precursor [Rhodomonas sp. CS24]
MYKPVIVAAALCASASAFAPAAGPGLMRASARPMALSGLRMQTAEDSELAAAKASLDANLGEGFQPKGQSQGPEPGFDPLGFADSIEKLRIYREAELKHGRLAMLAALGWPVAEFLNGPISKAMGAKSFLFYATKIQKRAGFRATMAALGAEDLTGIDIDGDGQVGAPKMLAEDNYMPGDLGFDPLGLYKGKSAEWKRDMQLKELNNGRLAMIAITGYAFNEAATKVSVVKSLGL